MRAPLRLPRDTHVSDVADASRKALDEFLSLDPHDSLALAQWFAVPYRTAVRFARTPVTVPSLPSPDIVASAQDVVCTALTAAARPGAEGLVSLLPSVVHVLLVEDVFGAHGYAPIDHEARLVVRALTLLLADYLTRPDDYFAYAGRRPTPRAVHATAK